MGKDKRQGKELTEEEIYRFHLPSCGLDVDSYRPLKQRRMLARLFACGGINQRRSSTSREKLTNLLLVIIEIPDMSVLNDESGSAMIFRRHGKRAGRVTETETSST